MVKGKSFIQGLKRKCEGRKGMKKRRIIGILLIIMSLLLQVSYAAVYHFDPGVVVGSQEYNVVIHKVDVQSDNEFVEVKNTEATDTTLGFSIKNLYPGASFNIIPTIKNYGSQAVKITSAKVMVSEAGNANTELVSLLRGKDEKGQNVTVSDYNAYLEKNITGQVLKSGEEKALTLSLGIDSLEKNMKDLTSNFKIIFEFEQNEVVTSNPSNSPSPSSSPSSSGSSSTPATDIEDEGIPGNPIDEPVIDETPEIPERPVVTPVPTQTIDDEEVPAAPVKEDGKLPKTGGIAAIMVYVIGIVMLVYGIWLYRKKKS